MENVEWRMENVEWRINSTFKIQNSKLEEIQNQMKEIHLSQARRIMQPGQPVSLDFLTADARQIHLDQAISLKWDFSTGTRTIKTLPSGQIRRIRDVLILAINNLDVYI